MNIKEAKEQIQYAMTAYFARDELGSYEIPTARQRPIFLIGAPGIGKTAIMEQIAEELGVLLVSYSMTHHTRQSALGLPYIADRQYDGQPVKVSEYTMSEIVASVYDAMEQTGIREGILFLDEINCVSETLTPSILQFLQFKTFGRHRIPDGWIVVTAGNPPEYNRSVREFDIVTMDRLKKIVVEPDFDAWKEYAYARSVHPAILSYLEIKKNHFYHVETTAGGKTFVTARGWDDLSQMIRLCEKKNLPVNGKLVSQYLQDPKIASDFAAYYDLFQKYQSDYQIDSILSGEASEEIKDRAKKARFDERIALLGLLIGRLSGRCGHLAERENALVMLLESLKRIRQASAVEKSPLGGKAPLREKNPIEEKTSLGKKIPIGEQGCLEEKIPTGEKGCPGESNLGEITNQEISRLSSLMDIRQKSGTLSKEARRTYLLVIRFLRERAAGEEDFPAYKEAYGKAVADMQAEAESVNRQLTCAFRFLEEVYPQGQEMLLFVTELTVNEITAAFLSHYGNELYHAHSKDLMFYERNKEIAARVAALDPDSL